MSQVYASPLISPLQEFQIVEYFEAFTFVNNTTITMTVTIPNGEVWKVDSVVAKNGDNVTRNANLGFMRSEGGYWCEVITASATVAGDRTGYPFPMRDDTQEVQPTEAWFTPKQVIQFSFGAGGASTGGTGYIVIRYRRYLFE